MQKRLHGLGAWLRLPLFWLFAVFAEAAAIFILSVIPSVAGGINGGVTAHFLAYTVFSFSTGVLLITKKAPRAIIKGALIAALFGGCIELVQLFIPYRACEFYDFAVNCIAAMAGMAAAGALQLTFLKATPSGNARGR
jgi:VanZ family protein